MSEQVQIGPYRVLKKLGYGGMAVVYHATDTREELDVALKILLPQYYNDEAFIRRFAKEGLNARRLNHPNIVKTFNAGHDDSFHYIAMQFINGTTLEQYVSGRGALTLIETLRILGPIASALDYAHELGYIHRDMKLNNIMRSTEGRCLLTDFGVSKHLSTDLSMMTGMGQSIGTPSYMSPEQARGERLTDGKSDIYSLGVIAYRLLTGHLPFVAQDPFELAHKIIFMDPLDPRQINPLLDKTVALALKNVIAKDPESRPNSCRAFVDSLSGLNPSKSSSRFNIFPNSLFNTEPPARTTKPQPQIVVEPVERPFVEQRLSAHRISRQHDKTEPGTRPVVVPDEIKLEHVHAHRTSEYTEVTLPGTMAPLNKPEHPGGNDRNGDAESVDLELTKPVSMDLGAAEPPRGMKSSRPQPYVPNSSGPNNSVPNSSVPNSSGPSQANLGKFVPGEPLPGQPPRPRRKRTTTVLTKGIKAKRVPPNSLHQHRAANSGYSAESSGYGSHRAPDIEQIYQEADWFGELSPSRSRSTSRMASIFKSIDSAFTMLYRVVEPFLRRFRKNYNLEPVPHKNRGRRSRF